MKKKMETTIVYWSFIFGCDFFDTRYLLRKTMSRNSINLKYLADGILPVCGCVNALLFSAWCGIKVLPKNVTPIYYSSFHVHFLYPDISPI